MLAPWKTSYDKPKKQRHYFANKCPSSQSYGFSSSHVWMWQLNHKEGWAPKNWCFRTVVLKKTLESPLDSKEIKLVNSQGNQPWIFIGRTDAKAEAPIFWPPDGKSWLIGKIGKMLGKIEGRGRRGQQRMRWLDGIIDSMDIFGWTPGVGYGQGGLACCGSWGCRESDTTEQLNWLNWLTDIKRICIKAWILLSSKQTPRWGSECK